MSTDLVDTIDLLYGPPLDVISNCLRGCIVAAPGHDLLVADFSAIEARGIAWLAGEERVLDVFRTGADIYCHAAGDVYGRPISKKKDPDERQIGKVVVLACIAEGQPVLTPRGLVPIEAVRPSDLVWDGIEWVAHEGVVDRGVRDVQEYQGLTATADHIVFAADGRELPFGDCARQGIALAQTGAGRRAVRLDRDFLAGGPADRRAPQPPRVRPLRRLWRGALAELRQSAARVIARLSELQPTEAGATLAGAANVRGAGAVREPRSAALPALRRPRDRVPLRQPDRGGALDPGQPGPRAVEGDRSAGQRRTLRAGQPAMGDALGAASESAAVQGPGVAELGEPVLARHDGAPAARGDRRGRDHGDGDAGGRGAPQELAGHRRATRVYDLLNAGPRHRFTVSGVLVHNCGYQGSVGAFQAMARGYGVKVPDAKVKEIVSAWRAANPAIVSYWYAAEEAAISAVTNKGQVFTAGPPGREVKYLVRGSFLFCRLPSGRALSYPYPKLVPYVWIKRTTPGADGAEPVTEQRRVPDRDLGRWLARGWKQNGEPQPALHYKYVDGLTKAWTEGPTYGGSLVENITQAVCRDLLASAIVRLEARGYPIIMHVHDEVVSEVPEGVGDLDEFNALVAEAPAWAKGFPITAEGWRGKRYRK